MISMSLCADKKEPPSGRVVCNGGGAIDDAEPVLFGEPVRPVCMFNCETTKKNPKRTSINVSAVIEWQSTL